MVEFTIDSVQKKHRHMETTPALGVNAALPEGRFLAAVPPGLRTKVWSQMSDPRRDGRGLRAWPGLLEAGTATLTRVLPRELVEVHQLDHDAETLHDCESGGMAVPFRSSRRVGHEPVAGGRYFPSCPCCGGPTGRFAFWSREIR